MTKIAIFGSTGMTGLCVTEAALQKGLNVRALLRDPLKLPEELSKQIEVVQGNVLNFDDVLKTIQGTDAVIVALGTRNDIKPTTELSEGLKNIVKAMKDSHVDIISVCLSAFLFFDPSSERVPPRFKDVTDEHRRMYEVVKESGLKYIAVFPPHIADQPPSSYQIELDKYIGRTVSKFDLGKFLVDSIGQPEYYGHIIGIISK